jgi:hypothetical protein
MHLKPAAQVPQLRAHVFAFGSQWYGKQDWYVVEQTPVVVQNFTRAKLSSAHESATL